MRDLPRDCNSRRVEKRWIIKKRGGGVWVLIFNALLEIKRNFCVDVMSSPMRFKGVTMSRSRNARTEEEEEVWREEREEGGEDAEPAELWMDPLLHGCSNEAGSSGGWAGKSRGWLTSKHTFSFQTSCVPGSRARKRRRRKRKEGAKRRKLQVLRWCFSAEIWKNASVIGIFEVLVTFLCRHHQSLR